MDDLKGFEKVVPYLEHPLVLIGFTLLIFFGIHRLLIKSGIIPPVSGSTGGKILRILLRYGFIIALTVLLLGFGLQFFKVYKHSEIQGDIEKIVHLLEDELRIKNTQLTFLQGQLQRFQSEKPSLRAQELGDEIPENADPYALALKSIAQSKFDEARQLLTKAQESKEVELSKIYEARGQTETYANHYIEAFSWYQKALALQPDNPDLMRQTALAAFKVGKYTEAESLYQQALFIKENASETYIPDTLDILDNLAELYLTQERYAEAEPLYRRALAVCEESLKKNMFTLETDEEQVETQDSNTEESFEADHKGLDPLLAVAAVLEKDNFYTASLMNLARLYKFQGRYAEAELLYQRALVIDEQIFASDHPELAFSLSGLADLYRIQGRYAEAEPLYQRAVAISEDVFSVDYPQLPTFLNNLAYLYRTQGRYAEAELLYQRALDIYEQILTSDHLELAFSLSGLADLYRIQGRYAEAELLYQRAVADCEKSYGKDSPHTAIILYGLAELYYDQKKYTEALPLHEQVLAILEKTMGQAHEAVAASLNKLAELYKIQGKYTEAQFLYQRALAVCEKTLGRDRAKLVDLLVENYSALLRAMGKDSEASVLERDHSR